MEINLTDNQLLRLIKSYDVPNSMILHSDSKHSKLFRFCGNQYNEDWEWIDEELSKLSYSNKKDLYMLLDATPTLSEMIRNRCCKQYE